MKILISKEKNNYQAIANLLYDNEFSPQKRRELLKDYHPDTMDKEKLYKILEIIELVYEDTKCE